MYVNSFVRVFARVEVAKTSQRSLTYRTELRVLVGAHAAILCWTIDFLHAVASTLIHTDLSCVLLCLRSGDGCACIHHVFPLHTEVV